MSKAVKDLQEITPICLHISICLIYCVQHPFSSTALEPRDLQWFLIEPLNGWHGLLKELLSFHITILFFPIIGNDTTTFSGILGGNSLFPMHWTTTKWVPFTLMNCETWLIDGEDCDLSKLSFYRAGQRGFKHQYSLITDTIPVLTITIHSAKQHE